MKDDELMKAAAKLKTDIPPQRDLWSGIAEAIEQPRERRRMPMFAQAAAVVMLVGASSLITYMTVKEEPQAPVIQPADMIFQQASFGNGYTLGPGFQAARSALAAELDAEMRRLSPEARQNVAENLQMIQSAIVEMNEALEQDPENLLLQERLLTTYHQELALLRRVGGLSRNVSVRNDI